ncbi:MAG TPA: energy transducer TonB [Gammaproteobacteria bacterium]|nr:energy transducer TonB [Gammaproteobacteria bacterium]
MIRVQPASVIILAITVSFLIPTSSTFGQAEDVKSLIREASRECRTAKQLRRENLEQAQTHFKAYTALLNKAIALEPNLLNSNDPAVTQVLDFCNIVKNDLERAEALPLFESGLRECSEARVLISNAAFDEARQKYQRYQQYKEGALAISQSVLDVYENSYEIRLCDRLEADIKQAELEYKGQLQISAKDGESAFKVVLDSLSQSDRQCRGAENLINDKDSYGSQTVGQIQSLAAEAEKLKQEALSQRRQLLAQGRQQDGVTAKKIDTVLGGLEECLSSVTGGITRVQATLAARKTTAGGGAESATNTPLRQIVGAPASYPQRAIRRNIEGFVTVKFIVTKTGDVDENSIQITQAEPEEIFNDSVISAVKKYKFQPRVVNGVAVDTKDVEKKVVFKLQ